MAEWARHDLGDIVQFQRGHDLPTNAREEGLIPIIGSFGITGTHSVARYPGPGVAIGRSGAAIGKATYVDTDYWPLNTCLFVRDFKGNDPRWVYWLLRTIDFTQFNSGSAQPSLNRNYLRQIPVSVPAKKEQRAIAEVLGALDDKIASNTHCITTTSGLLDAHYRAAIVDERMTIDLAEVSTFHNRKRVPLSAREREKRPGIVPYYGASGVFGYVDKAIFDEPLVLVGEDGSVITDQGNPVTQYIWGPAWVNNHAHVLTGVGVSTELLYLAIRRARVDDLVTGAVQPKINMGNLKRLQLQLPSREQQPRLESLVQSGLNLYRSLSEQNETLAAMRDALLPALMSGRLRVKDAERQVEAVV